MEILHKSKTDKVYKNKKLNNANFGTYNLNDYQVFLQLISKLGKVDVLGTYKQSQDLERKHLLTAKEFSSAFNVDINTTYRILKTAGKRLARTAITLEKPDLFVTQEIPICSFAEYNNKEGSLTIEFNEHIMPYLAQVKQKFVLYNLKEIANFGSLYTTRLYELIQEFKNTGWILKSVEQLREIFAVGKKFPLYGNFKAKTFAHAVEEINSQYELKLRFEEIKEGRKVVAIRFEFITTFTSKGYNPATKEMVNVTVKPRRINQEQPELPNLEPTLVAKRAKEKEYRDRHKAKKMSKLEHDPVTCGCRGGYCEIAQGIKMDKELAEHVQEQETQLPVEFLETQKEELIDEAYNIMAERIAIENETLIPHPSIEEFNKDKAIAELKKLLEEKEKKIEELIIEIPKRKKFFGIF
jgi:plasmid replication initiation protein